MIDDKIEVKISTKPSNSTERKSIYGRISSFYHSKVYIEPKERKDPCNSCEDSVFGNNSKKLLVPSTSAPLPMNSARMDMNTCIITIPASGLDCPSLHGKGLCISPMTSPMISPTSSARTESSYNYSQILDNKSSIMSSLHSAIYFAEEEVREGKNMDEDYCVGYSLSAELWPCS